MGRFYFYFFSPPHLSAHSTCAVTCCCSFKQPHPIKKGNNAKNDCASSWQGLRVINYSLPGLIIPMVVVCWELDLKDHSPPPWHCTTWGGRGRKKHEGETSAVQENGWSLSLDQLLKQSPGSFSRTLIQCEAPLFVLMMLGLFIGLKVHSHWLGTGRPPARPLWCFEPNHCGPTRLPNGQKNTSYYVKKIK